MHPVVIFVDTVLFFEFWRDMIHQFWLGDTNVQRKD